MNDRQLLKETLQESLSILVGYFFLGAGFGILFRESGASILQSFMTAILVYAGSMQYALVGLLQENTPLLVVALTTLAMNGRYFFYGIFMLERYKEAGKYKPFLLFWMSDETFALISRGNEDELPDRFKKWFYLSGLNYSYWVISCTIGAILGNFLPFSSKGIEFIMTALFLTIFLEQWLRSKNHIPAISGLVVTFACLFFFSREQFLLLSLLVLTIFLMFYGKRKRS